MYKKFKRIAIDAAGYSLIILGILLGWLPGPGGIPLVLAGLGLLSVHNHWARRILEYFKDNGLKIVHYIFPNNPWAQAAHDFLTVGLLSVASYLVIFQRSTITIGLAVALSALAVVDFLYNRNRLHKLKHK